MLKIPALGCDVVCLAAAALLTLATATGERAQALSLINSDAAVAAKIAAEGLRLRSGVAAADTAGAGMALVEAASRAAQPFIAADFAPGR